MNSANKRAHNQQEEKQGESWRTQDITPLLDVILL